MENQTHYYLICNDIKKGKQMPHHQEYVMESAGDKIVTSSTLSLNDNQKIIEQFKEHGFEFHGEPIIQSDGITHWSFMVKNGLVNK